MRLAGEMFVEGGRGVREARRNVSDLRGMLDSTASAYDEVSDKKTCFLVNR